MKRKPCPIKGCQKTWLTEDGLGQHLYIHHCKGELTMCILAMIKERAT